MPSILTVGQIKTEIRSALGGRTDLDDRLNNIINMMQLRLARIKRFDELEVTDTASISNTADDDVDRFVTVPTNNGRLRNIYSVVLTTGDANSRKLRKVLSNRWDLEIPDTEYFSRDKPNAYTLWGNSQIEIFPLPDTNYTLRFRLSIWPATVSSDADFLTLENLDDGFIALAISYCFMSLGEQGRSDQWFKIYATVARDVFTEEQIKQTDLDLRGDGGPVAYSSQPWNDPFVRAFGED